MSDSNDTYTLTGYRILVAKIDEDDWAHGYKSGFASVVALRESPLGLVIYGHGGNNGDFRYEF